MSKISIYLLLFILTGECLAQEYNAAAINRCTVGMRNSLPYSHTKYDSVTADTIIHNRQELKYLNPEHAFWLAFFPGLIVRGAGHLYARKYLTTTAIIATTAVGLYLYLTAEDPSGWEGLDRYGHPWAHENKYYYWQKHSGLVLFWGTWAYDMIAAPIVCIRHNRRVKKSVSLSPCLMNNRDRALAGIHLTYCF